ncbi:hypothetical protein D3C84_514840 [compost metagenome]
MLKDLLEPLDISHQTARYELAGLETQLERERRQIRFQPCNERLNFRLIQELFALHPAAFQIVSKGHTLSKRPSYVHVVCSYR